jgi:hypothetical protein
MPAATTLPYVEARNLDLATLHTLGAEIGTAATRTTARARVAAGQAVERVGAGATAAASSAATAARAYADRLGHLAEDYVGTKIKRRVQPPIVVALVVAGAALVVALIAVATRRR